MDSLARALGSNEVSSDEFRLTATRPEEVEPVAGFLATVFHAPPSRLRKKGRRDLDFLQSP
jgi:hypothetical protein